MLNISSELIENKIWYSFTSRGTEYSITPSSHNLDCFDIFSQRSSLSYNPQIQVLTESEMRDRSKVLGSFLDLIKLDKNSSH